MESSQEEHFLTQQSSVLNKFCDEIMPLFDDSKMNLVQIENIPGGFVLYNAFSEEECKYLRDNITYNEDVEYKHSTLSGMMNNSNNDKQSVQNKNVYRKNLRLQISHQKLADSIFERVKKYFPQNYLLEKDEKEFGPLTKGNWLLSHLNPRFRICKYLNEGFFGPHYDGCYVINQDLRSLYTFMFYLNEEYEGGETAFLDPNDSDKTIVAIKPKTGMMIFFPQDVYHEGRAVIGEKYIFRTDLMFKRDLSSVAEVPQEIMDKKKEALMYLDMAQQFEMSKNGMKAVECYRKAFKLDPDLEKVIY